ncbi:hypothetical protein K2173_024746 [Erythroxylum novogranatense]|uniref:CRC domain-containing protein n=1 Tax=Erythroxylum novogranatense TaxID=1862640 RepID=A0AAV8SVZ8_9ROSI|nr:hypothetical protein K2173_024746 [Erythroxylum novogranatense]
MDASSPETPSSPIQESPFFSNVKNLTPICSAEAVRCLPIPSPVFRSPRIDIQRPASFSQREEKDVEGSHVGATSNVQLKPGLFCSAEMEVQSCSASGSVDDYLVDPIEVGDPTSSPQGINKPNSLGSAFNSQRETVSRADDVQQGEVFPPKSMDLVQNTEYKRIDEWFDEFLECASGAVCDSVKSDKFMYSFPESQDGAKLTTQAVRLRRFIQSETRRAMNPDGVSFRSTTGGNFSHVDDHQYKNQVAVKASSTPSQSLSNTLQPFPSLDGATFEQRAACEGIISTSQSTELVYKSDQLSAKTNRKRAKSEIESKRCSCRRSRCLKLYCECFAAGLYCLESCTCENCFNSTGYEDVVIDHRQQIEARDPLAFTSKVVIKSAMNTPADMKDGTWSTPPSARHKRGCNCKKTRCLKRYCECYQAGVGCSDRCHCECCDNSFGKREGKSLLLLGNRRFIKVAFSCLI